MPGWSRGSRRPSTFGNGLWANAGRPEESARAASEIRALMAGEAASRPILEPSPCLQMNFRQKIVAVSILNHLLEKSSSSVGSWVVCAAETIGIAPTSR